MSEANSSINGRRSQEVPWYQKWPTSALLITFTVTVALSCIIILACTLTQTRVTTLVIDGVGISIPKLDYVGRQWAANRRDSNRLTQLEQDIAVLSANTTFAQLNSSNLVKSLNDKLAVIRDLIGGIVPDIADKIKGSHSIGEQYGYIVASKAYLIEKDPTIAGLIEELERDYDAYQRSLHEFVALTAKLVNNEKEIDNFKKRINQTSTGLFNYIKPDLDKDKDAKARIENAFYELNIDKFDCGMVLGDECGFIDGHIARGLYYLLTLRPDLLTLMLVVLMGVLGSALQITHAYFMKNQVQTVGGYFQRITVGAITALVIFIVAKAGVPIIADTSRLGGDASINPYFISFLAIVSGLLSENAITNIQAQGAKFFGPGDSGPARWAREDLTPELLAQNLPIAKLAAFLGVSEGVADAKVKGEEAINAEEQKLIAIYLRRELRDIFTDIAPPPKAA